MFQPSIKTSSMQGTLWFKALSNYIKDESSAACMFRDKQILLPLSLIPSTSNGHFYEASSEALTAFFFWKEISKRVFLPQVNSVLGFSLMGKVLITDLKIKYKEGVFAKVRILWSNVHLCGESRLLQRVAHLKLESSKSLQQLLAYLEISFKQELFEQRIYNSTDMEKNIS